MTPAVDALKALLKALESETCESEQGSHVLDDHLIPALHAAIREVSS